MSGASRPKRSRGEASERHARLREQGLRPIRVWVPDVRSPDFRAAAHSQSLAVSESAQADADQDFIDAASEEPGDRGDTREAG